MGLFMKLIFNAKPARHSFATYATKTRVGLLGVPYNRGSKETETKGLDFAPTAIRNGNLVDEIKYFNEHVDFKDFGDLKMDFIKVQQNEPTNMHHYNEGFQTTMHRLCEKVCEIRNDNRTCVTLGGDHAIAVGELEFVENAKKHDLIKLFSI